METPNSLASSRRYERVLGLKKKRIRSFILVFEDMSPENRLSTFGLFLSSFVTHNMSGFLVNMFSMFLRKLCQLFYSTHGTVIAVEKNASGMVWSFLRIRLTCFEPRLPLGVLAPSGERDFARLRGASKEHRPDLYQPKRLALPFFTKRSNFRMHFTGRFVTL